MIQHLSTQPVILITGSTGFVCKHLVDKLLSSTNFKIVITYRKEKGSYDVNNRLVFEYADLLNPLSFENIYKKYKPEYVIHLAAMARVKDGENNPAKAIKTNLLATITLAGLSIKYQVKSMIYATSNMAQDATSIVGASKLLTEQYFQILNSTPTKFVGLRMPNVIDSSGAVTLIFKKQIDNNQPITITHPDMSRMFVTAEKAGDFLYYLTINGENKAIYVSYEKPVKITDLANNMINESGKNIEVIFIGMKPGEKLTEKTFAMDEVITTDFPKLGKLKNYKHDKNQIELALKILSNKEEISSDKDIQGALSRFGLISTT